MLEPTWVVVACAEKVNLLESVTPFGELIPVKTFNFPEGRLPARELESDRPGQVYTNTAAGSRRVQRKLNPHEQVLVKNAKSLNKYLEKERAKKSFGSLVLVAEPKFLGVLYKELGPNLRKITPKKISRDLSSFKNPKIMNHVRPTLNEIYYSQY